MYNILMFIIPFFMLIISFILIFKLGYKVGYAEGLLNNEKKENEQKHNRIFKPFKKSVKESEEERLFNISLQNIESYDGSGRGQKEVE